MDYHYEEHTWAEWKWEVTPVFGLKRSNHGGTLRIWVQIVELKFKFNTHNTCIIGGFLNIVTM